MVDFDKTFERLIGHEGEYVNDPDDPGGETKFGISKRSYPHLNIKTLTLEQAKDIYSRDFWEPLINIHPAVRFQAFDFAVNSGMQTAIRKLQQAIGAADDGHWGPRSQALYTSLDLSDVIMRYTSVRLDYMTSLQNWPKHGKGWARRIAQQLRYGAEDN